MGAAKVQTRSAEPTCCRASSAVGSLSSNSSGVLVCLAREPARKALYIRVCRLSLTTSEVPVVLIPRGETGFPGEGEWGVWPVALGYHGWRPALMQ